MGMWENDVRSGSGLIVTLDGIYNEGRFSLNKLMVSDSNNTSQLFKARIAINNGVKFNLLFHCFCSFPNVRK